MRNSCRISILSCCCAVVLLGSIRSSSAFVVVQKPSGSSSSSSVIRSSPPIRLFSLHANEQQPQQEDSLKNEATKRSDNQKRSVRNQFATAVVSVGIWLTATCGMFPSAPAHASDYGSLSDEQKLVAEAWRLVDNSFLDRTFNHQDWFQLRTDYVKNKKYKSMTEAQTAVEQMVATLGDKYTRYLPPAKYQSIVDSATGTLAGVGIEISVNKETGKVLASDVEDNAPAKKAGIQPGDIFVEVDGSRFDGGSSTPDDVALKLRGPIGSKVGVVMERDGKTLDYIMTREPITITAVKSYMASNNAVGKVGVVRIKSFSGTTSSTVAEKLADLKKQGAQAFVIDVRGNPGGLLPGGVDTASLFLDENKPVVFVADKKGVVDSKATLGPGSYLDTPLVLLVDSGTASAAEVFTAALKENQRAVVAGSQTFGKGIVQTIRPLSEGNGGVAITVARYETPQHHDINKQGIPVDIQTPIDCPKDDAVSCLTPEVFQKAKDEVKS